MRRHWFHLARGPCAKPSANAASQLRTLLGRSGFLVFHDFKGSISSRPVSYTHLRAHETEADL
eukprot:4871909-Amphidinium_carterae.1